MNKHLSLLLAVVLLALAFVPVSANPPEPDFYSVTQDGACWLPDGAMKPTNALSVKQEVRWMAPIQLVATCWGQLPKEASWPKEILKLTYEQTQRPCRVEIGRHSYMTANYGATVHPDGVTEITCWVDMR